MSQFSHVEVLEKRRHVSRTTKTSGASDISRDYSQVTPRKTHKWSLEEAVTLILLVRTYENTWAEKRKIFNSYIEDELNSPHHFTEGALRTMYRELQTKFTHSFGNWYSIQKVLKQKADSLCVPLIDCAQPQTLFNSRLSQLNTGLLTPITKRKTIRQTRFPRLGFRAFDISNQGYLFITDCRPFVRC